MRASSNPHGSYGELSTLHSKMTSGSLAWNVKSASNIRDSAGGLMSIVTTGATPVGNGTYSRCRWQASIHQTGPEHVDRSHLEGVEPGLRFRYSAGYSQSSHASGFVESNRHSNTSSGIGEMSSLPM